MKEVVWIFGISATGKETFINHALQDSSLREQLGWKNKAVAASKVSLQNIGHHSGDAITELRDEILQEVPILLATNDVVLVKHQAVDFESSRHTQLKAQLPNTFHRIIVLEVPNNELRERLVQKSWWNKETDIDSYIRTRLDRTKHFLHKLRSEFAISYIDSSSAGHYKAIPKS